MRTYAAGSIRGTWNRPECHLQALQRFQDDGNVSRCYTTGRPELQRRIRTGIWQLMPKETDGAQNQTCLVSSLQLPVRQFQGRPCKEAWSTLVYMLVGLSDVFHVPQLTVAFD
ncbi:uncharacterized protein TNCV_2400021 [Trichonephila clavipes]|uniref:Uncharacterized protein n=1 Tax=Trichonephila clavipes TaxID=2585209 RepID=A0A8X6T519_TRICX|nr:uncharacterized protein TNCV_2400021 [Trichonephila clavipes]